MFTDAEKDYFERKACLRKFKSRWKINDIEQEPENYNGPNLEEHGLCTLKEYHFLEI